MLMRTSVITLLALALGANAQNAGPGGGRGGRFGPDEHGRFAEPRVVGAMAGRPGPVVRGAPYSAAMVTETTQVLPDGNRIRQTNTAKVFRDSEGRVRSETSLAGLGVLDPALAGNANPAQMVFITDSVAGVRYVLNQKDRTVTKTAGPGRGGQSPGAPVMVSPRSGGPPSGGRPQGEPPREWSMRPNPAGRGPAANQNVKVESIGRQTIEGIPAEGSRTTMTIPAGQIGNEQAIQIVSERWYSPELQTVVLSRHSDPRVGETVFRLTGISRSEPPASLFQPPPDFKMTEMRGNPRGFSK